MTSNPTTPAPEPATAPEGELHRRFGDRWTIELEHTLGVYSAVRKSQDGRHIRCIIARSAAEMISKLETAELVEPDAEPPADPS
jgi:hypothetical protein